MWDGREKRSGKDRRTVERRRSVRYSARNLIIIDGVTWIDADGTDRRRLVRRAEDRENLASRMLKTF